jgi:hypothetical protein
MSFDPDSISDRMDMEPDYPSCPYCKGRGFTYCEPGNPNFVSPCGCDEIEDEEAE